MCIRDRSYLVERIDAESCRLRSSMQLRFKGLSGLASPLLRRLLLRDTARDEASLKALLEAPVTAP